MSSSSQLHQAMPVYTAGAPLAQATAAMVMLHGRGARAHDILTLVPEWDAPGVAFLAPQAANNTWYPNRFLTPLAGNEPWFSSALRAVAGVLDQVRAAGLSLQRIFLFGFSQGGCLALEYAARHPQRYAGVIGLSAALIENGDQPRTYTGSLAGTPVLLGCSDVDFHVPLARLERTATLLAGLGALVDKRIYPNLDHTINRDELTAVQHLLDTMQKAPPQ